jgi:hypothetical protein
MYRQVFIVPSSIDPRVAPPSCGGKPDFDQGFVRNRKAALR